MFYNLHFWGERKKYRVMSQLRWSINIWWRCVIKLHIFTSWVNKNVLYLQIDRRTHTHTHTHSDKELVTTCVLSVSTGTWLSCVPVYVALFKGRSSGEEWRRILGDRENRLLFNGNLPELLKWESHTHLCVYFGISVVLSAVTLCLVMKYVTCHSTCTKYSVKKSPVQLG